jgi:hypothetical protein
VNTWPNTLIAALNVADAATEKRWIEDLPRNMGLQLKVATLKSSIDGLLASHSVYTEFHGHIFLINMGMNDALTVVPSESQWKSDYQYILDAIIAKYPEGIIYIAKPYSETCAVNCAMLAGWIDDLVLTNSTAHPGQFFVGHDESTWSAAVDDADKIHYYNTAGQAECAAQWYAILHP